MPWRSAGHPRGTDAALGDPRGKTPTHWLTMGMDPDLVGCVEMALCDMIVRTGEKAGLSREDAHNLGSLTVDFASRRP